MFGLDPIGIARLALAHIDQRHRHTRRAKSGHVRGLGNHPAINRCWPYCATTPTRASFAWKSPSFRSSCASDGSNVEDMLANFKSETAEKKSSTNVAVDLAVVDGTIKITDQSTKQNWQIDKVNVNLNMPADNAQAMTLKATAEMADARQPGKLSADVSMKSAPDDKSKDSGDISVQSENLPLAMAQSFVARYLPQARLDGRLNCQRPRDLGRRKGAGKTIVQAELDTDGLPLPPRCWEPIACNCSNSAPPARSPCRTNRLDVEKTALQCDLGNFTITGSMNLNEQGKDSALDRSCTSSAKSPETWILPGLRQCCPTRCTSARKRKSHPARCNLLFPAGSRQPPTVKTAWFGTGRSTPTILWRPTTAGSSPGKSRLRWRLTPTIRPKGLLSIV